MSSECSVEEQSAEADVVSETAPVGSAFDRRQ